MKKGTSKDFFKFFMVISALLFFVLPWLLNSLFLLPATIKTAEGLGNAEWLGFWGAYISGALGVMTTILAFMFTYRQNEKQNRETQLQNSVIQEQNLASQRMIDEQMRMQILPVLSVKVNNEGIQQQDCYLSDTGALTYEDNSMNYLIATEIENVGFGPALDVNITSSVPSPMNIDVGYLERGEVIRINIHFFNTPMFVSVLDVSFYDAYNRNYSQPIIIELNNGKPKIKMGAPPMCISN